MKLLKLKVRSDAEGDNGIVALKPAVNGASLRHAELRSGPFWQTLPAYAEVTEEKFLDHTWQSKNSITRVEKLLESLKGVVSDDFVRDAAVGFQRAPMSVRVTPYIMSLIDWENPYTDPLRTQFIPLGSRLLPDHPKLGLDSLHEQADAPVPGLTHRYPDKALFLPLNTCPVYCRFCTRSYAVGVDTEEVEKVELRVSPERWQLAFRYIASRPELEDIVISGGDAYNLRASQIIEIGETLLAMPNIRRLRFATKGPAVMPQKVLTDTAWTDALTRIVELGRKLHKEVALHTHFNHPEEITSITQAAMNRLFERGITVRNQSVLVRGVNDTPEVMSLLVKRLGHVNVHPYYVYMHDLVQGVEDLRTSLDTALVIEKHIRGVTAGFNTPTFVVDAPGGGGKRDVHSFEHYDRETGVSVFTSPSVHASAHYLYFDPLNLLSPEVQKRWKSPIEQDAMIATALASAKAQVRASLGRPPRGQVDSVPPERIDFETDPDRYRHWKLTFPDAYAGEVARLALDVREDGGLRAGYALKLNSYDLGVDIELADAISRIRFEHPRTRAVLVTSDKPRIFSSGANIYMLASSSHAFKVNFCKFTNETRIYLEEMSGESHIPSVAALNATASGGGYELALACDEVVLVDDGSSVVSLPEAPSLGVLPGTGGLTRLSDKRRIRPDLADVFATLPEGVRGKRALEWRLIDETVGKSQFDAAIGRRLEAMRARSSEPVEKKGIVWSPLDVERSEAGSDYEYVRLRVDAGARTARITVEGPRAGEPADLAAIHQRGAALWALKAFRELDDVLLDLRFNHPKVGLVLIESHGDIERLRSVDRLLFQVAGDPLVNEILLHMRRVLRRLDVTSRSLFALVRPGSCFAGSLLELCLAADRTYMLDGDGASSLALSPLNGGKLSTYNGLSRLASRFLGEPGRAESLAKSDEVFETAEALAKGLVTFAPDEIDWDDEIRVAIEERTSLSPDALTGLEQNLRFGGPETMETKIFGRLSAWQNWIFQRPNAVGASGALTRYGKPERPEFDFGKDLISMSDVINDDKIPNNVNLSSDKRLQRALVEWQPKYLAWWREMGPDRFQQHDVFLRTAISVDHEGWAHFDYVKMPDYRWGIFLADPAPQRTIGFGDNFGKPVWNEVPGEHKSTLRRLIVTQGDTEPASVEQQRALGHSCPSLYDLRNLFQINVEEGRHLWAMAYLLHSQFGRDGREEAEGLLERRSGNADRPRILGAFNEPCTDWLSFFMFTFFADRDGKFQLLALAESGFDPLARTTRFMLTEEAHHMFVGETGVGRIVRRTAELMKKTDDVRTLGGIDLPTVQKYLNLWYSVSLDLFGGEVSSNAASFFADGLKGRAKEASFEDHRALEGTYKLELPGPSGLVSEEVPLRNAMNEVLRDAYIDDCQRGVDKWNAILRGAGIGDELTLPSRRFHREIGVYANVRTDLAGRLVSREIFEQRKGEWLPSTADQAYVKSLMSKPVFEPSEMANWIAPPAHGIKGRGVDFEYVRWCEG